VLDPSRQAHAHADRRLRSEQVVWLTTDRVEGYLAKYAAAIEGLGYEPGPFARTYSTAIRVRPTRARVW
jgi:hypothetical protein